MAVADIIVLATIGISFLFGLWRGLVKEALSLAFWIGAVILAGMFSAQLSVKLSRWIENPALQQAAAFVIIFIGTVFAGGLISNMVSRLTSAVGLKAADRGLGGLFGIFRGVVIVTVVVMLTVQFVDAAKPWYEDSRTVPYLLVLGEYFQDLLGLSQVAGAAPSA
jgi:membrane protein required for colicin V production